MLKAKYPTRNSHNLNGRRKKEVFGVRRINVKQQTIDNSVKRSILFLLVLRTLYIRGKSK
jgi:hypothetical protein